MTMKIVKSKNMPKRAVYALAYEMIKESIDCKCPLQAIAIEESILTDRLFSTLNVGKEKARRMGTLGGALASWKKLRESGGETHSGFFDAEMDALYSRLDSWRNERNALLHGIVKSPQGGHPIDAPDAFVKRAIKAAEEGLKLSRKVDNWTKRKIRAATKGMK